MLNPAATYRIQFHKSFTFKNFKKVIPYLHKLGVSTIYASPIFEATPGSNHGYDVVNPHCINPEIGTPEELRAISKQLKELNISWLQDIVPNHMAFHPANTWLMDVMEKGRASLYADFFDIMWDVPAFNGRLMAPFLGGTLEDVLRDGQLSISFKKGRLELAYGENSYPVNLQSYITILQGRDKNAPAALKQILGKAETGVYDIDNLKQQLVEIEGNKEVKSYISAALRRVNKDEALLKKIADEQYYQLCFWRDSERRINYRRFFTVNSLICLNIQKQEVFDHYHKFIKELLDEGIIQGLRVDHIDGLFDPKTYLRRLRELAGNDTYIIVEKILEQGEKFPADWPVQGNTGYDFLALINNLFTCTDSRNAFTKFYRDLAKHKKPVADAILEKKADILYKHMAGELDNLYRLFTEIYPAKGNQKKNVDPALLKHAIAEFLIRCPVYRYYGNQFPLEGFERSAIRSILKSVQAAKPELKPAVALLQKTMLNAPPDDDTRKRALHFYQRCMQFSGPLMAKGVEDTLMYTYDRFIGHNEVGDSPEAFGIKAAQFHEQMRRRQQEWPLSLNGTATHDTKRGEDVRAKLNVLTDIAAEWAALVTQWRSDNKALKQGAPDDNDEYLVYQTLAGFYPMPGEDTAGLAERLQPYLTKALREAKIHTEWSEPDEQYESSTLKFAEKLLAGKGSFWKSFSALQTRIADHAVVNSLAQVLLKFTCPGIPDVYQGCELWDFSLVDPDNRRPVNFSVRAQYLQENNDVKQLWQQRYTGRLKLWLTRLLFDLRKADRELFAAGDYLPLQVGGQYSNTVFAFARRHLNQWLIVAVPLHTAALADNRVLEHDWNDTAIHLPKDAPLQWQRVTDKQALTISDTIPVKTLFSDLPLSILRSAGPAGKRGAGIIMHITSLPAPFGIGDLGPEARNFAGFLARSNQRYWQLLPLNPTAPANLNSPYSSFSSMAGNIALISPADLGDLGLLTPDELGQHEIASADAVDFEQAYALKDKLLDIAWERFSKSADTALQDAFFSFKQREAYWLDDFAAYQVLKAHHKGTPWYKWPEQFKCRAEKSIKQFIFEHKTLLERIKWFQFIFFRQWSALKCYGNRLGIKFIGDLPFYVSYDSADVWRHPEIFKLDENKAMKGIAGVPPDYFNDAGQLWGMPVYDWGTLKAAGYSWWVDRIKKNMEFFDLIRLDHFRAFHDFWEVPARESTAINGNWQPGPGAGIFSVFKKRLGTLPFIAEDLGDISKGVYDLRDELNLPGMNVLQYAFGADMPVSIHIPHNHLNHSITYTGTHDNNTTAGWYRQNASAVERNNLNKYAKTKVNAQNASTILLELCYASVAETAIAPLQDVLGLDERSRMNTPASKEGNWLWRLKRGELSGQVEQRLRLIVKRYNR